jgi:hypothetical protein
MATIQDVYRRQGTATRVLNTEIKKEIIRQNAVDTGRMRNVSKIVQLKWNEQTDAIDFEIDSTFYYQWVERKPARKWKNASVPRNITEAFTKREKVVDQLYKFIEVLFEYRIDQQFQ